MAVVTNYAHAVAPCNVAALTEEVHLDPLILTTISYIDYDGVTANIWMKDVLTAGEISALAAVAAAHAGAPQAHMVPGQINQSKRQEAERYPFLYGWEYNNPGLSFTGISATLLDEFRLSELVVSHENPTDGDRTWIRIQDSGGTNVDYLVNWVYWSSTMKEFTWTVPRDTVAAYPAGYLITVSHWAQAAGYSYFNAFGYHTQQIVAI